MSKFEILKLPAEIQYADELAALCAQDAGPKPAGWRLSPAAVKRFIVGSDSPRVSRKFYGDDVLVERAIVTLAGNRGLMLVGEPGTAKSMLSELLAAAISGNSLLTIQGTAGTTEDQIKYAWNYALLLAEGPGPRALVPGPIHTGMKNGCLVRFEEITRCQPEIQDTLVSLLSEKCMMIPEFGDGEAVLSARPGFNLIATANLRDRGVNEMSSALKRRFNFETVFPIRDKALEMRIVREQTERLLSEHGISTAFPEDTLDLLVTTFRDLREGRTEEGAQLEKPGTVMSTAEAVSVSFSACLDAHYFGGGPVGGAHICRQLAGTVFKDDPADARKLDHYLRVVARLRASRGGVWETFYNARAVPPE
ncbi:MAG: AAA family ATPase [Verrucomicrobia bacterium]|nr:AAA family ATPase [Verrucomicrobiota bacterium]MCH8513241.1 AAA family ATPase [Kiritimatiellia bacterium]